MNRTIVIGDIHGCIRTLQGLLYDIVKIDATDNIIFTGDYIDRGKNSKEVVDEIMKLIDDNYNITLIRGNHEQMLLNSYYHPQLLEQWKFNGAKSTLKSFEIEDITKLPEKYLKFFNSTIFYIELDEYFVTHAGMNFEIDNPLDDLYSMLWTRNRSIDTKKINGKALIVGHTPSDLDEIKKNISNKMRLLDGGCVYYDMKSGKGFLVALDLTNNQLYYLQNQEEDI